MSKKLYTKTNKETQEYWDDILPMMERVIRDEERERGHRKCRRGPIYCHLETSEIAKWDKQFLKKDAKDYVWILVEDYLCHERLSKRLRLRKWNSGADRKPIYALYISDLSEKEKYRMMNVLQDFYHGSAGAEMAMRGIRYNQVPINLLVENEGHAAAIKAEHGKDAINVLADQLMEAGNVPYKTAKLFLQLVKWHDKYHILIPSEKYPNAYASFDALAPIPKE